MAENYLDLLYGSDSGLGGDGISSDLERARMTSTERIADDRNLVGTAGDIYDDPDSSTYFRLKGGDSPEVFHDIKPTGDIYNERKKVYEQVQYLTKRPMNEVIAEVDAQAEAYKVDPTLPDQLAEFRKKGILKDNYTSFDIYKAGRDAKTAADKDALLNPETAYTQSGRFATGEYGAFGRSMADNKEFVDRMIKAGYMIPGSNDAKEYELQVKAYEKAKKLGMGNFGKTGTDPKVMDAIFKTSYGQRGSQENIDDIKRQLAEFRGENTLVDQVVDATQSGALNLGFRVNQFLGNTVEQIGDIVGSETIEDAGKWYQDVFKWNLENGTADRVAEFDRKNLSEYENRIGDLFESGEYVQALTAAVGDKQAIVSFFQSAPEMVALMASLGGMVAVNASNNLEELHDKAEKAGKEVTNQDIAVSLISSAIGTSLDRLGDKAVLSAASPVKDLIQKTLSRFEEPVRKSILKEAAKTAGISATRFGAAIGVEGATEAAQTALEKIATDVETQDRVLSGEGYSDEEIREIGTAGFIGAGAGGVPAGARVGFDVATEAGKGADAVSKKIKEVAKDIGQGAEKAKVDEEVAQAEVDEKAGIFDFNDEKLASANEAIDQGDIRASFAAIKAIDESVYGEDEASQAKKTEINSIRARIADEIQKVRQEAIVNGDEKAIERLGSSEDAKENIGVLDDVLDSDDIDLSDEKVVENIKKAGKKLNLDDINITGSINSAKAKQVIRKSFGQVEDEVVSDPNKGYLAKFDKIQNSIAQGNEAEAQAGIADLQRFKNLQESKADELNSGLDETKDFINNEVTRIIDQGLANNRVRALGYMLKKAYKNTKIPVEYSSTGKKFEINVKDVVLKELKPDQNPGVFKVLNAVNESVGAMDTLVNGLNLDEAKADTQVEAEVEVQNETETNSAVSDFNSELDGLHKKQDKEKIKDIPEAKVNKVEFKEINEVNDEAKIESELEMEAADVSGIAEMLKIPNIYNPNKSIEIKDIIKAQQLILKMLSEQDKLSVLDKDDIAEALWFIDFNKYKLTKDREERATYKTYDQKTGAEFSPEKIQKNKAKFEKRSNGNTEKYIGYQLAEEIGEFLVEYGAENNIEIDHNALEDQKRAFKVLRFGEDTVINDEKSEYNGMTNIEALAKRLGRTSIDNNELSKFLIEKSQSFTKKTDTTNEADDAIDELTSEETQKQFQEVKEDFTDISEVYTEMEQDFTEANNDFTEVLDEFTETEFIQAEIDIEQTTQQAPEQVAEQDSKSKTSKPKVSGPGRFQILKNNLDIASQRIDDIVSKLDKLTDAQDKLKAKEKKLFDSIGLINNRMKRLADRMVSETNKTRKNKLADTAIKLFRELMNRLSQLLSKLQFKKEAKIDEKQEVADQLRALAQIIRNTKNELRQAKQDAKDVLNEIEGTSYIDNIIGKREYDSEGKQIGVINGNSIVAGKAKQGIKNGTPQEINPVNIVQSDARNKSQLSSIDLNETGLLKGFANSAVNIINSFMARPGQKYKDGKLIDGDTNENLRARDSLGRGLLYSRKDGTVVTNKNVATSIALAAEEYIAYMGSRLSWNTPEDVARMLGIEENDLDAETYEYWKDKGKFKKAIANQLGKAILSSLALKAQEGVEKEIYEKLISDLGNMAVHYMETKNYIQPLKESSVASSDYKKFAGAVSESGVSENAEGLITIPMVKLGEGINLAKVARDYKNIEGIIDIEGSIKKPMTKKPSDKDFKIRRNDVTEPTAETSDTGNTLRKEEYTVSMPAVSRLIKMNKDTALKLMGYTFKADMTNMGYDNKESAIARNRELEKSYNDMIEMNEGIQSGESESMWFDWFISRNGRFMTDTGTIDPQNEKQLHRWLVQPKSSTVEVDMNNAQEVRTFKFAVAQAFGYDIDKSSTEKIEAFADKVLNSDMDKLELLLEAGEPISVGKAGDAELIKVEHLGHTLQGLEAVQAWQKSGDKNFTTSLTVEFDAVTSGFILKMMQLPVLAMDKIKSWLAKGGVFVGGKDGYARLDDAQSMNDEIADHGIVDGYRTLAGNMKEPGSKIEGDIAGIWGEFKVLLPKIKDIDNIVTGEGRALFKAPLMTFGYGAALKSIRRHLGYKMIEELGTKLLDGSKESEAFIDKTFAGKNKDAIKKRLREESIEDIKINIKKPGFRAEEISLGKYLRETLIDGAYGQQVETILTEQFQPMIDANNVINNSFKMMFRAWKNEYDAEIAKLGGTVTAEQEREIIEKLRKVFPLIKAPLGNDETSGVAIYTKKTVSKPNYKYDAARTHLKTGQSKVQSMINEFEEAISAGAVIPIHYIDGSIMTQTLAQGGRLGVHDALVLNIKDAANAVKEYNENTYNISKGYNMVSEILESMKRVRNELGKDKTDALASIKAGKESFGFNQVGKMLAELEKNVTEAKGELFANDMRFMHMSAMPGTGFDSRDKKFGTDKKVNKKVDSKSDEQLEKKKPSKDVKDEKKSEKTDSAKKETKQDEKSKPTKLVWNPSRTLIIDEATGKTKITINSYDELLSVSSQYQDMLVKEGRVKTKQEVLDREIKFFTGLAKDWEKAGIEFKPTEVEFKYDARGGFGGHSIETGKITLATMRDLENGIHPIKVLLHEYAHRITVDHMKNNPEMVKEAIDLKNHALKHNPALQSLYGIHGERNQNEAFEFIAEVMTSPALQSELAKIPPYKDSTIIEKVKEMFQTIIDRMTKDEKSALTDALQITAELTGLRDLEMQEHGYGNQESVSELGLDKQEEGIIPEINEEITLDMLDNLDKNFKQCKGK